MSVPLAISDAKMLDSLRRSGRQQLFGLLRLRLVLKTIQVIPRKQRDATTQESITVL
jgi:hypothetical protein